MAFKIDVDTGNLAYSCTFILYFYYRQSVCPQLEAALSGNKADDGPHTNRPKSKGDKEPFRAKI